LKPVAWRKKIARPKPGPACQAKLLVARFHSTHSCSKTRMGSNRFWHIVSVVKERLYASLSSRVASSEPTEHTRCRVIVNSPLPPNPLFHTFPQPAYLMLLCPLPQRMPSFRTESAK